MTTADSATRELNKQTLRRAMNGITALDLDAIFAELHESSTFELPYESAVPDTDGAGFRQLLSVMFVMFKKFDMILTDIYDLVDPNVLVARYRSDAEGREKPVVYQNEYIGIFHFVDGKISAWREYANPEVAHQSIAKFADDAATVSS